jgi:hypothetical protein
MLPELAWLFGVRTIVLYCLVLQVFFDCVLALMMVLGALILVSLL